MFDDHGILHLGAQSGDLPASRATFPKIDSRGCLVELDSNGRASLAVVR
jgi:hypothetical protein